MITRAEAEARLQAQLAGSPRLAHSRSVAALMASFARALGADVELWEIVGLLHDIDDRETAGDRSRHGLVAAQWLRDDLPPEALAAIAAHDHRTGVIAETPLADGLKLADALALVHDSLGPDTAALLRDPQAHALLGTRLAESRRPYLVDIIAERAARLGLPLDRLAQITPQS